MSKPRRWIFNVGDLIEDDFSFVDSAEYDALKQERDELLDALMDCFNQACAEWTRDERGNLSSVTYDHMCLSSYEDAQDILIKYGKIKREECLRK